jgi:plastocyanin
MRPKWRGRVTSYRLWVMLVAMVVVTTLILVGSAVAQNSSVLVACSLDQYGQNTCDSSTDPNACIIDGSIVRDQYTCDQRAQEAASEQAAPDQNAPTVSITENAFDPAQAEVTSGTPLTFVNDDTVGHAVSLEGLFDTPEIPAGSSYPVTLDGTGTVTYHDQANPEMQGTITVGEAS